VFYSKNYIFFKISIVFYIYSTGLILLNNDLFSTSDSMSKSSILTEKAWKTLLYEQKDWLNTDYLTSNRAKKFRIKNDELIMGKLKKV